MKFAVDTMIIHELRQFDKCAWQQDEISVAIYNLRSLETP